MYCYAVEDEDFELKRETVREYEDVMCTRILKANPCQKPQYCIPLYAILTNHSKLHLNLSSKHECARQME